MIRVAGKGWPGRIDACRLIQAGAEVEAGRLAAAGEPEAALEALVAARRQAQAWLQARTCAATGENLDDPANGIAAIDRRA